MQGKLMAQIQNEYLNYTNGFYTYALTGSNAAYMDFIFDFISGNRTNTWNVFKKVSYSYDSFKRDIAMVHIIYKKSTLVKFGSQQMMTWVDYFSQVGGILGLLLGMGFMSFIEIIWLCGRVILIKYKLYMPKINTNQTEEIQNS